MEAFAAPFRPDRRLLVGTGGIAIDEFLSKPVERWVGAEHRIVRGIGFR